MLTPEYLAGVFDSDGSFSISKRRRPSIARGFDFNLCLQVTWADSPAARAVLGELAAQYGGSVHSPDNSGNQLGTRPILHYVLNARRAEPLLRDLLPHLRLKREQAECCLRFLDLGVPASGVKKFQRTPDYIWDERDALATRVRSLNKGGAHVVRV